MYGAGPTIQLLLGSGAHHYLEFKLVQGRWADVSTAEGWASALHDAAGRWTMQRGAGVIVLCTAQLAGQPSDVAILMFHCCAPIQLQLHAAGIDGWRCPAAQRAQQPR